MGITFQKRQKEFKRQEKQRAKAEKREQRKLAKRAEEQGALSIPPPDPEQELPSEVEPRVPSE